MISWIQRTFQKHFRLVFGVMLVVMAVPLVWVFNASSGMGRAGPKALRQRFFGYDLVNRGRGSQLMGDATLSVQTRFGPAALSRITTGQLQQFSAERLASIAFADQLRLPAPTAAELTSYLKTLPIFAGPDGQFDPSRYAAFRDNLKIRSRGQSDSEADFVRVLSDDLRVERVKQAFFGPGYVLPGEVRDQLARTDTRWEIAVATADYAAFKPEIAVAEDALKRFFEENAARYEVLPRTVVDYVAFPAARYLAAVTLSDADVRNYYDANSARFPRPAPKPPAATPPNPDADFAAVRPAVEQALRAERAQRLAVKAASDFTLAIYDAKLKPGSPAFDALLAKDGLTLRSAPPFTSETVPADLGWTPQVIDEALHLGDQHAVSDPLTTADGSIVLFWRQVLPSFRPELAQVRDRVIADFREDERRKRFFQWGRSVSQQLAERVKAGDPFEAAAARVASGEPKLVVKTYPPFLRRQSPQDLTEPVAESLDRLSQGQVSEMLVDQNAAAFVYAKEKKLPDLTEANPQYALTRMQLAAFDARSTADLSMSALVRDEWKRSGLSENQR